MKKRAPGQDNFRKDSIRPRLVPPILRGTGCGIAVA